MQNVNIDEFDTVGENFIATIKMRITVLPFTNTIYFSVAPLRARKSENYRYRDSWKSDNLRKRAIKKEAKN